MTTLNAVYHTPARAGNGILAFRTWSARARQRRQLRGLLRGNGQFLKDAGLCRHDIANEAWKPFWQA